MATNFPGSLDSYTTKNAGDTISESHVNNLQDAVVAIETKEGTGDSTPVDTSVFVGTGTGTSGWMLSTPIVQIVNVMSSAVATGTTALPNYDTIPQITEGDEYMTLAITPKSATNKLKIEVTGVFAHSTTTLTMTVALFQDATAGALAAAQFGISTNDVPQTVTFTHYMEAGTTSATTFRIRAGNPATGTTTFNGSAGSRKLGGVMASSITITEISI